ncbi:hypothetical protein RGQ13_16775 [Thalassotalea psychrophila]|uniref:Pyrrolidone-carboxylate peptidase n=1 Tax=Thalassotalea psychrophila TaxID=3065647 RepID=A0ABY9TSE6_9GAMM|nr:hypothetical protein RGQ13_16775 [Colwelliaceae bacterium SQ149]
MLKITYGLALIYTFMFSSNLLANVNTYITVEEVKIGKAKAELPKVASQFDILINKFSAELVKVDGEKSLHTLATQFANSLWLEATSYMQTHKTFDDRALYWGRLQMAKHLRVSSVFYQLPLVSQSKLMSDFELASRGLNDVKFTKNTDKKILVTGFDPFYLHRNIAQSNPSGIAAINLDGVVIEQDGVTAEIQTLIVPVRFADFDQGMIETMLTPHIKSGDVDMVTTISMGRKEFDLERFPGLRRSSVAPGNLGVYTGANSKNPLIPFYQGKPLDGPEFVEFSLPIAAMQKAKGKYQVIDNAAIETLQKGKFTASSLADLANQTAVQGSGGGYLSNEISYRSILIRNQFNPKLPVGHIHTPRIKDWQKVEVQGIVDQIEQMFIQALVAI